MLRPRSSPRRSALLNNVADKLATPPQQAGEAATNATELSQGELKAAALLWCQARSDVPDG